MAKKMTVARNLKLADQIQRDLAHLIQHELSDLRLGLVTLQEVVLTTDYTHAKIYYTVLGAKPENVQRHLEMRASYLRRLLFKRLHIHTVPTLHFYHDCSIERGASISTLIDQVLAKDSDHQK